MMMPRRFLWSVNRRDSTQPIPVSTRQLTSTNHITFRWMSRREERVYTLRNIMAEMPKRKVKVFIFLNSSSSKKWTAFSRHPSSISNSMGVTALKAYRKVSNMALPLHTAAAVRSVQRGGPEHVGRIARPGRANTPLRG